MSGRRLRDTVRAALKRTGAYARGCSLPVPNCSLLHSVRVCSVLPSLQPDTVVVIAGLANSFSHYVTTYEEYQAQRYEGASVLYGPQYELR